MQFAANDCNEPILPDAAPHKCWHKGRKPDFRRKRERTVPKLLKPTFEPHRCWDLFCTAAWRLRAQTSRAAMGPFSICSTTWKSTTGPDRPVSCILYSSVPFSLCGHSFIAQLFLPSKGSFRGWNRSGQDCPRQTDQPVSRPIEVQSKGMTQPKIRLMSGLGGCRLLTSVPVGDEVAGHSKLAR